MAVGGFSGKPEVEGGWRVGGTYQQSALAQICQIVRAGFLVKLVFPPAVFSQAISTRTSEFKHDGYFF